MALCAPRRFLAPKAGNRMDEYEDASGVANSVRTLNTRIAVTDGASESAFAGRWAQILANAFVGGSLDLSNPSEQDLTEWLQPCEQKWNLSVPWDRIPWHGEAKARFGALATLLAVTVDLVPNSRGELTWHALSVGDCCLFIIRHNELYVSFPLDSSGQLNNTPPLICSNPSNNRGLWSTAARQHGELRSGDVLILTTDAVAGWILDRSEAGDKPWDTLLSLTATEWEGWVQKRRAERSLKNDDTTAIIIPVK